MALLDHTPRGLYCAAGDFYIDPWRPVERAVITHAHADHARPGHGAYLAAQPAAGVLRARLGAKASLQLVDYGHSVTLHGVRVSLHPAGHVLGSAQIRVEYEGEVWVVSGDYKLDPDPTCAPFESVRCDVFVTESTFGLPIYRWARSEDTFMRLNTWWWRNAQAGRASVIYGYSFGKAQRILASVDPAIGPILTHDAVESLNQAYRLAGVRLPATQRLGEGPCPASALVVVPPMADPGSLRRRLGEYSDAFASGWMALRSARRRHPAEEGIVLSDHADWPSLLTAIEASGAPRVLVTHGQVGVMVRYLRERGLDAAPLATEFEGEAGAQ